MRRVITLLVIGALGVVLFSPPTFALDHNPDYPRPFIDEAPVTPYGDDGGWNDPTETGLDDTVEYGAGIAKHNIYDLYNFLVITLIDVFESRESDGDISSSTPNWNK